MGTSEHGAVAVITPAPTLPYSPEAETSASAVAAREKATVEARYLVAINRPRDAEQARLNILAACRRPRFAKGVRYAKPIGTAKVEGLSIRFAEEACRCWGNMAVQALLVFDNREKRIYRVFATDLETNATPLEVDVIIEKVVERKAPRQGQTVISKRKNSQGQDIYLIEADEEAMLTKANAMISKARRNCILAVIPSDIKEEAEEVAMETMRNRDAKDPAAARKDILDAFFTLGVMPEQVQLIVGGKPLEQINPAELTLLRSVYTALKEGETTWAEVEATFAPKPKKDPEDGAAGATSTVRTPRPPSAPARLAEKLGKKEKAAPDEALDAAIDAELAKED